MTNAILLDDDNDTFTIPPAPAAPTSNLEEFNKKRATRAPGYSEPQTKFFITLVRGLIASDINDDDDTKANLLTYLDISESMLNQYIHNKYPLKRSVMFSVLMLYVAYPKDTKARKDLLASFARFVNRDDKAFIKGILKSEEKKIRKEKKISRALEAIKGLADLG